MQHGNRHHNVVLTTWRSDIKYCSGGDTQPKGHAGVGYPANGPRRCWTPSRSVEEKLDCQLRTSIRGHSAEDIQPRTLSRGEAGHPAKEMWGTQPRTLSRGEVGHPAEEKLESELEICPCRDRTAQQELGDTQKLKVGKILRIIKSGEFVVVTAVLGGETPEDLGRPWTLSPLAARAEGALPLGTVSVPHRSLLAPTPPRF